MGRWRREEITGRIRGERRQGACALAEPCSRNRRTAYVAVLVLRILFHERKCLYHEAAITTCILMRGPCGRKSDTALLTLRFCGRLWPFEYL